MPKSDGFNPRVGILTRRTPLVHQKDLVTSMVAKYLNCKILTHFNIKYCGAGHLSWLALVAMALDGWSHSKATYWQHQRPCQALSINSEIVPDTPGISFQVGARQRINADAIINVEHAVRTINNAGGHLPDPRNCISIFGLFSNATSAPHMMVPATKGLCRPPRCR